jgi:hypothetical protein
MASPSRGSGSRREAIEQRARAAKGPIQLLKTRTKGLWRAEFRWPRKALALVAVLRAQGSGS